jgi:ribosome-associated translation inhibitor RaiA
MQIEVTTDHNVDGSDARNSEIIAEVEDSLSRFSERLTRVEVHLADESAGKVGSDHIRCTLEARPARQQPVVTTDHSGTVDDALAGALDKLVHLLGRHFDRLHDHKGGDTVRGAESS